MFTVATSVVFSLYSLLHPVAFTARGVDALPHNIQVDAELRSAVARLLAQSRTLRAQCARIAASPATHVTVRLSLAPFDDGARARSRARRYESGLLVVDVQLPPASRDFAELLAHELEHVTELIEGVDLHRSSETDRARSAGLAAAAEVGGSVDEPFAVAGRLIADTLRAAVRFARGASRR